ncbi:neuromedin U [Roseibium sp.]|uniref:neuromedin U n=1 Tax=Roseibium sp. TaxID=1936156 RepID=UPI003BA9F783
MLKRRMSAAAALCLLTYTAHAQDGADDLAAKTQNPIASMISLPFENTFDFGAGNGDAWILNVQPVIPVTVGNWNLVSRVIAPLADAPGGVQTTGNPNPIGSGRVFGLGDINYSLFFSPADAGPFIWGVGPSVTFPTATDERLGSQKLSMGPTAVVLTQPKPWSLGVLARQLWSVAGPDGRQDVNQFMVQPFVNYNFGEGWYAYSDPAITANWNANSDQMWTVPAGAGLGKIFKIGNQPMNVRAGAFANVIKPDAAPDWYAKLTVQFLFPK